MCVYIRVDVYVTYVLCHGEDGRPDSTSFSFSFVCPGVRACVFS